MSMDKPKVDLGDLFMGFVGVGLCDECGKETFAADGVCAACKVRISEEDRVFFDEKILDCE